MNVNAKSPEESFLFELEHFRNETVDALCFHYVPRAVAFAAVDRRIHLALNQTALFWNLSAAACQAGLFVVLGRIFDQNSTHNIDSLMRAAQRHRQIFEPAALEQRKRASSPNAAEWLPEYMTHVYAPTREDFRELRRTVEHYRGIYEAQFRPIRHRYVAHREVAQPDAVQELFSQAQIAALEEMLSFLVALHAALQDLFDNGNRPELRMRRISVQELVAMPIERMPRQSAAELAIYDTRKTLELVLKGSPEWVSQQA